MLAGPGRGLVPQEFPTTEISARSGGDDALNLMEFFDLVPLGNMAESKASNSAELPGSAGTRLVSRRACDTCHNWKVKVCRPWGMLVFGL